MAGDAEAMGKRAASRQVVADEKSKRESGRPRDQWDVELTAFTSTVALRSTTWNRWSPWHEQDRRCHTKLARLNRSGVTDLSDWNAAWARFGTATPNCLTVSPAFCDGHDFVPMNRAVFDRAAELRARHRIKTPDALHLSAALEYGCEEFWTNDDRLASVAGGITVRAFK